MKGLDTNVLVRYLVRDEPAQERALPFASSSPPPSGESPSS